MPKRNPYPVAKTGAQLRILGQLARLAGPISINLIRHGNDQSLRTVAERGLVSVKIEITESGREFLSRSRAIERDRKTKAGVSCPK